MFRFSFLISTVLHDVHPISFMGRPQALINSLVSVFTSVITNEFPDCGGISVSVLLWHIGHS